MEKEIKSIVRKDGWAHKYLQAIKTGKNNRRSLAWLEETLYKDAKISNIHGHVLGMAWGLAKVGFAIRDKESLELTELGKSVLTVTKGE